MDALIVYPENKEQLAHINTVKIAFDQISEVYPDHVIKGVKESLNQAKERKLTLYTGIRDMLGI